MKASKQGRLSKSISNIVLSLALVSTMNVSSLAKKQDAVQLGDSIEYAILISGDDTSKSINLHESNIDKAFNKLKDIGYDNK